jgi:uncharacterized protein (DUF1697 family)
MKVFVALLRAINLGGTGKLTMTELKGVCDELGFKDARTYIQTGNVIFRSALAEPTVKAKLEKALAPKLGKSHAALVRTRSELESIIRRNPFKSAVASRVLVLFLDEAPARDAFSDLRIPGREKVKLDGREVYIHYPDGMGRSKLKLPLTESGTGRNLNTVVKLAALSAELEHN